MRIGKVAASAGVNVQTVRFYERRGLLEEPFRLPSGYRSYHETTPDLIRFIKRAQSVGFTLNEIQELIEVRNGRSGSSDTMRSTAESKIDAIRARIRQLKQTRDDLERALGSCKCFEENRDCEFIVET